VARFFNTAGPCKADLHYMLDPVARLGAVRGLIERQSYFVLHAPRQVGKTTSVERLARALTDEERFAAALVSCESGAPFADDPGAAEDALLEGFARAARRSLPADLAPPPWPAAPPGQRVGAALEAWAARCPRPLVLFVDEIDSLSGPALVSVLRQLREGFRFRPQGFPWSVALVGMRDVRDYKLPTAAGDGSHSSSPFNVKEASLTLRNFTRAEVAALYAQHTLDTGQRFDDAAVDVAHGWTDGQPWLVNALAREATDVLATDRGHAITAPILEAARERVILRQDTHLDSLAERLREERVRRVIEPIVAGAALPDVPEDDLRYVVDLGLVRRGEGGSLIVANPIYREVRMRSRPSSR
jgi:type II secretory pathway predicted ATPase ExeA